MTGMEAHFTGWRTKTAATLKALKPGLHPKTLIAELGERLLAHYAGKPLIAKYDVYQHLMDYWAATMQDDCYLIAADGWKAETYRIIERDKKGKEKDKGWTCDLVPKLLIVARYFAKEQAAISALEAELESLIAQMNELEEEHGGEEGLLEEARNEKDKLTKASVSSRLRELRSDRSDRSDGSDKEEAQALKDYLALMDQESTLGTRIKEAEADLDAKALAKYPTLTEAEVKTLVVEDKWMAALAAAIHGEMDRISQTLTQRVKELAERYETPLPQAVSKVADLEQAVNRHLERMGFSWN